MNTTRQIYKFLYKQLKVYGAMCWHISRNDSCYIKFKDCRLGSIRISNHKGRSVYNYKYEIYIDNENLDNQIKSIITEIKEKVKSLHEFNFEKYIVYYEGKYKECENYEQYKKYIIKKQFN